MITYDMVNAGYEEGLIKLIESPNGDGIVCKIGDNWFYFGGQTAEEYKDVESYKNDIPKEDIIKEIYEVLNELSTELEDEYLYYEGFLRANGILPETEKSDLVSLWGRLGVQIDMTPEEFEVLKKNDVSAKDLLVELIKSDRCYLSGESYFPPDPNEKYIDEDLDFDFEFKFQPLQRDEFEAMEQTLLEQKENPEIWALRGEISNLRHELDGALIYDPDYAPTIEKCLVVRELELNAALEGVKLNLDPDDIIDAEHLDCFWYGGPIGSLEYKGYTVSIEVHGDVRLSVLNDKCEETLLSYNNRNNSGAYEDAEVKALVPDDETLHKLCDEGRAVWSNNNWVEYRIFAPDGEEIDTFAWDNVLDNNVLEAFADVSYYKDVIEKIALENKKEVDHSLLADNIADASSGLPKSFIYQDLDSDDKEVFVLGATSGRGEAFYLGDSGSFVRSSDTPWDTAERTPDGVPVFHSFAEEGLYFEFDMNGKLEPEIVEVLNDKSTIILNDDFAKFVEKHCKDMTSLEMQIQNADDLKKLAVEKQQQSYEKNTQSKGKEDHNLIY